MYSFEMVSIDKVNQEEFNNFEKKNPFTTIPWLYFLSDDKKATPIIVRITDENQLIGYYTGLVFKKFGFKFFGSPFKGWSTNYMGFDLFDYGQIKDLLAPTIDYVMSATNSMYLEMVDRNIAQEDVDSSKFISDKVTTLVLDIARSDEELLQSVKKDCKEFIRQFERRGGCIEVVQPDNEFVRTMHKHLIEVFAKQNLSPPYSIRKIESCVRHLKDSGMLLCLRVKEPRGQVIASYIFVGLNDECVAWCTSSTKEFQRLRPNEYMVWYGIRYFRDRGCKIFDFSGPRGYKYKWNPQEVNYIRITATKYAFLKKIRDYTLKAYWLRLKIKRLNESKSSLGNI